MGSIEDRLRRLEATLSPGWAVVPLEQQALEDYFDVLEGQPVEESTIPP